MAGRKGHGNLPGRKALRKEQDRLLKVAAGLDRLEPGVGDEFCREAGAVLSALVARRIRNSESETRSDPVRAAY